MSLIIGLSVVIVAFDGQKPRVLATPDISVVCGGLAKVGPTVSR